MSSHSADWVASPRRWSTRALPACLIAMLFLVVSVLLLIDVVHRVLGARHSSWLLSQAGVLDWLAEQRWDAAATLFAAASFIACGAGLTLLALLPGNRDLLPMRSSDKLIVGYVSASSARQALLTSALHAGQVVSARVRLSRRRATVVIRSAASERAEYDAMLSRIEAAVQRRFESFGLTQPRRVKFRVKKRRERPIPAVRTPPIEAPERGVAEPEPLGDKTRSLE